MSTLIRLCLLLAAFSTLVLSECGPWSAQPNVYADCSGDDPVPLPHSMDSTPLFKPQIRVNPLDINNNGSGWEEWMFLGHHVLEDGSQLIYSCKWALGEPTSANISHTAFIALVYFPNGTFFREIVHDVFRYKEYDDGGFTYSVADNHLTWDPTNGLWKTSVNSSGLIIESSTAIVEPDIPFVPNYQSVPGKISKDFFSRVEVPRGHTDGHMTLPWGLSLTLKVVSSLKHTWSNKVMADAISAYVRGSTFLPHIPPLPAATVTWYQAWDSEGNEVDSMQYFIEADGDLEEQVFRLQITDAPDILSIVTTPQPVALPLSYENTVLTLPMCGPGADFEDGDQKMVWKANNIRNLINFVDFSHGSTLYQQVNMTGVVWIDGAEREIAGGIGVVEIYHR